MPSEFLLLAFKLGISIGGDKSLAICKYCNAAKSSEKSIFKYVM